MLQARLAVILLAVSAITFSCQSTIMQRRQEETAQKVATMHEKEKRAAVECRQKRLKGELKSHVESVQCSNPLMLEAHREAGDPNMDLMQLLCAYRLALAERNDKGEMTEAEAQVVVEKLGKRLSREARRRATQQQAEQPEQAEAPKQRNDSRRQDYGALLQGLGASGKPIVCNPVRRANGVVVSFTCQ